MGAVAIVVQLVARPILPEDWMLAPDGSEGAIVTFSGHVRGTESGSTITALEYEAYAPMAEQELCRIASECLAQHGAGRMTVVHRTGVVPVGEAAVVVAVASAHRKAALACMDAFLDHLKRDVPIWKIRVIHKDEIGGGHASPD